MYLFTVNSYYTDIQYNDKTRYNGILNLNESLTQDENGLLKKLNNIVFNIPRNICPGYLTN